MSASLAKGLDYPSAWQCDQDKFNWYCDLEEVSPSLPEPVQANRAKPLSVKEIRTTEQLRQELKRREDVAIMEPTETHLKSYLELWQVAQEKGAVFADQWRRVVWQNAQLDYSASHPVNNAAIQVQDQTRRQNEDAQLRRLAQTHGLIFFFRSNCPYCHAMAPTLKMLSQRYGIEVLGVSLDGGGLPDFPHPQDGRRQAAQWGVERVPALFLASRKTAEIQPIGFGVLALTEIVNRLFVLTQTKLGQDF